MQARRKDQILHAERGILSGGPTLRESLLSVVLTPRGSRALRRGPAAWLAISRRRQSVRELPPRRWARRVRPSTLPGLGHAPHAKKKALPGDTGKLEATKKWAGVKFCQLQLGRRCVRASDRNGVNCAA